MRTKSCWLGLAVTKPKRVPAARMLWRQTCRSVVASGNELHPVQTIETNGWPVRAILLDCPCEGQGQGPGGLQHRTAGGCSLKSTCKRATFSFDLDLPFVTELDSELDPPLSGHKPGPNVWSVTEVRWNSEVRLVMSGQAGCQSRCPIFYFYFCCSLLQVVASCY